MKWRLIATLFALLNLTPAFAQECERHSGAARLPPTDESSKDVDLHAFLAKLRQAVAAHDAALMTGALAPSFIYSLGTDDNIPSDYFEPGSPVWRALGGALYAGGAFIGSEYCIPYVYASFPSDIEASNHQVVVGPAQAHETPSRDGRCLARLEHTIVRTDYGAATITVDDSGERWAKIYLNDKPAFVPANVLQSPLGFRACFAKVQGKWRIKAMVEGD